MRVDLFSEQDIERFDIDLRPSSKVLQICYESAPANDDETKANAAST